MIDEVANLTQSISRDILAANASTIAQELQDAAENKMSLSINLKLSKGPSKVFCTGTLAFSRKFKDEIEDSIDVEDPSQPELEGVKGRKK
jgi:hypothetical protein